MMPSVALCAEPRWNPETRNLVGATGFEPATPCAQGKMHEAIGGSARPLPLFLLGNFTILGNTRTLRAAPVCHPFVTRLADCNYDNGRSAGVATLCGSERSVGNVIGRVAERLDSSRECWPGLSVEEK